MVMNDEQSYIKNRIINVLTTLPLDWLRLDDDSICVPPPFCFLQPRQLLHKLSGSLIHEHKESSSNLSLSSNENLSPSASQSNMKSMLVLSDANQGAQLYCNFSYEVGCLQKQEVPILMSAIIDRYQSSASDTKKRSNQ